MTRGKFTKTGRRFVLVDMWKTVARPHLRLSGAWVGTTSFMDADRAAREGRPRDGELVLKNGVDAVDLAAVCASETLCPERLPPASGVPGRRADETLNLDEWKATDDVKGGSLDPQGVHGARREELAYLQGMGFIPMLM